MSNIYTPNPTRARQHFQTTSQESAGLTSGKSRPPSVIFLLIMLSITMRQKPEAETRPTLGLNLLPKATDDPTSCTDCKTLPQPLLHKHMNSI